MGGTGGMSDWEEVRGKEEVGEKRNYSIEFTLPLPLYHIPTLTLSHSKRNILLPDRPLLLFTLYLNHTNSSSNMT